MVAKIVVDREMPVRRHGERNFGEEFLDPGVLVAELMRRVDSEPGSQPGDKASAAKPPTLSSCVPA